MRSIVVAAFAIFAGAIQLHAQGSAFTYQGRLNGAAGPATGTYDFAFTVYDASFAGNALAAPVTNSAVSVSNGLFTATIDAGSAVFNGNARWLEIAVRTNGSTTFFTLSPRQAFTPSPYSITAGNITGPVAATQLSGTIPSSAVAGTYNNQVTLNNANNQITGTFSGNGAGVTNVNAATLNGLAPSNFWQLGGNNVANGQFIGSTNNQPVEIWVNKARALRLEPGASVNGASPNVVAGSSVNFTGPNVIGAVVAGGGATNYLGAASTNRVYGNFGTIGGGSDNLVSNAFATVVGGQGNAATGDHSTAIGWGANATGSAATAIGSFLQATGNYSVALNNNTAATGAASLASGQNTTAQGVFSTAMGHASLASGNTSVAMGYNAQATNDFTFVWSDGSLFTSTADNQFLVHAANGVGINTNNPSGNALNVAGNINATSFSGSGSGVTNVNAAMLSGLAPSNLWQLGGNNVANGQFIGSTNNQPFEIWANNSRALRIEPNTSPNIIGGSKANYVPAGVVAATIAGGGISVVSNVVNGSFGTIGGGEGNIATNEATVGGGFQNIASGAGSVISGGGYDGIVYLGNNAAGGGSAIGGGNANTASGLDSDVTGGKSNQATNQYATVAGGQFNVAGGTHSLAAGRKAVAQHNGSFVWADETDAFFQTSANNQFLIRASGGVGINTNNPNGSALSVVGNVTATSFSGDGTSLNNVNSTTLNGLDSSGFWRASGNNVSANQFIGSTNNQSVQFRANNKTVLILSAGPNDSPNIEGGAAINSIDAGVQGSVISGGGSTNALGLMSPNQISSDFSAIGGGSGNSIQTNSYLSVVAGGFNNAEAGTFGFIGGGTHNIVSNSYATVVAGQQNVAGGGNSFVGGGGINKALGDVSVVAGGGFNSATNDYCSIGGGNHNNATGQFATVPGGRLNTAAGDGSFAAGQNAAANHQGAFVWADSQGATFASTGNDQFLIRAQGGVGINTSNPSGDSLAVSGNRTGGWPAPIGYFENQSTAANASPALRVVGAGTTSNGVLNVSATGSGLIAQFGNAVTFVADITSSGAIDATAFNGGSVRVGNTGTTISTLQAGQATMPSASGSTNFTVAFPQTFSSVPKVIFSLANDPGFPNVNDTFGSSISSITTTNFRINVVRLDTTGGWAQQLRVNWQAWQ